MYKTIRLQPKRDVSANYRHPWIFSGAIKEKEKGIKHGDLVYLANDAGKIFSVGTYSNHSSIAIRVMDFEPVVINEAWFVKKFKQAEEKRIIMGYSGKSKTSGYRLIFGEADGVPGLIVDRYNDVVVIQISTAGIDNLKPIIISSLKKVLKPSVIIERSDIGVRDEEKLPSRVEVCSGKDVDEVEFNENGYKFIANVISGQKTGFFLDQKDLRKRISELAKGRVLNLFSYTGANAVYALSGGAKSVHNVDSSKLALDLSLQHGKINNFKKQITTEEADIFQWFGSGRDEEEKYDMVVMDPPALIKNHNDVEQGKKAYHFLNRSAMRLVEDNGIFVTSSCSHFLTEEDMAFILRRASIQNGIQLTILNIIRQSSDHPQSVYFPESTYLKSFVCLVNR